MIPDVETRLAVTLPTGGVDVSAALGMPDDAAGIVAIAHGAGAGFAHPFLVGFAHALRAEGFATLRFNFPYAEAGRRMPGPASHAIATWTAVATAAAAHGLPLWAAGKSYGGRMASMAAADEAIAPAGLVYLGYPLHPPGEPDKLRVAHLPTVPQPQLFVSGTADPFVAPVGQLEEAVASCRDATLAWIQDGGHSFEVKGRKRPAGEVGAGLVPLVAAWMRAAR